MASAIDVLRSCLDSIRQISDEVSDAVVYLDAGCLEAFQFIGAFPLLLQLGVRAVCSLENMSSLDIVVGWNSAFECPAKKMIIMTSRLLSDAHRYILRCLDTHQTIVHCTIFTSISEIAHSAYVDSPLGPDAFHEYESLLLQDYEEHRKRYEKKGPLLLQNKNIRQSTDGDPLPPLQHEKISEREGVGHQEALNLEDVGWATMDSSTDDDPNVETHSGRRIAYDDGVINSLEVEDLSSEKLVVSVRHFPMIICPLSPRSFVFPSEGIIAEACLSNESEDALSPGLPSICSGLPSDGDDIPPGATLTAHFLYQMAAKMDLKMEIFSLGDLSKTIGKMLTDMSSLYDVGRRNRKSAGLLLVDRTLDLLTPCCHGDSIVDRVFSSLPRRKRIASISASRSSQVPSKSAARVERPSLDLRVPFETVFSEEPAMSNPQLRESIKAFSSGWNSNGVNGSADIVEHAEKDQDNLLDNEISLLSGSFLAETIGGNYMEELLVRKSKDGVMLIKKLILEALKRENVTPNIRGRLSLAKDLELHGLVKKLAMNELSLIRNRWIIQLALASEKALSEPHSSHWDAFLSAERILNINSLDTSHSLSSQIRDLINTSVIVRSCDANNGTGASQSLLSFQDALLLSMIGYILAGENFPTSGSIGPFSWEEEHSLKEAVVDAILENPACTNLRFLHGLEKELEANSRKTESEEHGGAAANSTTVEDFDDQWGSWDDEDTDQNNDQAYGDMQFKLELRDRVDNLFKLFHKLSSLKQRHSTFKEGLIPSESNYLGDANSRKGLLYKLLNTLLAKYDVPGLQYHSSAVGRFLKSGFGRFGLGQAKPLLGDQNAIIIFVVGGISSVEIVEIMEAVSESSRPEIEFVVGGTTLLTPDDMSGLLLGSSSYL
ncbi:Sec1-like protein [Dioscorea alata]|uniref:Sec1-like protein n=1 Tax=Dioscorea alata TaxID=55571 RepID=A0ACB7VCI3_DIOAL|nr:Sec1-like protein [Dioscorea alata]